MFAINIKTEIWNSIIDKLLDDGWSMKYKYDGYDAGIDHDYIMLCKGIRKIEFGWDNWCEGEIRGSLDLMRQLEEELHLKFEYGKPHNLKAGVIKLSKLQSHRYGWLNKILRYFFG